MELLEFYRGKKVLVTGHTGFKGSWFVRMLTLAGAQVTGYGLKPPTQPSMFEITGLENTIDHVIGDIRDLGRLKEVFDRVRPEIVFHLAAQPIVRESYREPVYTYETNVMGTVNVLECIRLCPFVRSFVNVTTDKVYENKEWEFGYRENDRLDGYDPYSNSKSCSELVTHSYKQSFFQDGRCAVSTCRAGNVIGGGDFADDRIIPDCIRAAMAGKEITVRNPYSLRPFQHVLEPLFVYMTVAKRQMEEPATRALRLPHALVGGAQARIAVEVLAHVRALLRTVRAHEVHTLRGFEGTVLQDGVHAIAIVACKGIEMFGEFVWHSRVYGTRCLSRSCLR